MYRKQLKIKKENKKIAITLYKYIRNIKKKVIVGELDQCLNANYLIRKSLYNV